MKAVALLGGPKRNWPAKLQKRLATSDFKIGVDRGSLLLLELGFQPDLAIGDFDSLRPAELAQVEKSVKDIRYSNPVKDDTDTELMITAACRDYQVDQLEIYGATGGRIDHFLSNLFMFLKPQLQQFAPRISLIDQQNLVKFLSPGENVIPPIAGYHYFAVFCLGSTQKLNIRSARYNLTNFSTTYPRIFTSNEFLDQQTPCKIDFSYGQVVVVYTRDLDRFLNA